MYAAHAAHPLLLPTASGPGVVARVMVTRLQSPPLPMTTTSAGTGRLHATRAALDGFAPLLLVTAAPDTSAPLAAPVFTAAAAAAFVSASASDDATSRINAKHVGTVDDRGAGYSIARNGGIG